MFEICNLSAGYGSNTVVQQISLTLDKGSFSILVGPNGSGKTTLLKVMSNLLRPTIGEVILEGSSIAAFSPKELAKRIAILPQIRNTPDFVAETLVAQGRYPHRGYFERLNEGDHKAIEKALELSDITHLRKRHLSSLSGGERQRVYLAMLLAQDTPIMLLDEPTTYLDMAQQLEILDLLSSLCERGKTIFAILHDIPLALRYADIIYLLRDGKLYGCGSPTEILQQGVLEETFDVTLHHFHAEGEFFTGFSKRKNNRMLTQGIR